MRFSSEKSLFVFSLLSLCSLCFSSALLAEQPGVHTQALKPKAEEPFPWLTGPLLTPSGHVIPQGHWNIEPYEFVTTNFGVYDHRWHTHAVAHNVYNVNTQVPIQYGLPAHFDVSINPQWSWNHTKGASHWVLNDLGFGFDYQLLGDKKGKWWPAVKLALRGNFPIGRYQKLNPSEKGTDIGGSGSWLPGVGLVMSHLYWWGGHIFFAPRMSFSYTFPTPVHVQGFNAYGGGHHTRGKVFPGQSFVGLFGFELALSQRWALAGDIQYLHANKTRFKGHKGATAGVPNTVGGPSTDQWSVAPAIEYDWSAYVGIIAGVWFTVGARNSPEFASAVVAVNIYK
jgi:hypothetical protein